jgi:serine/threonine-protein kinase
VVDGTAYLWGYNTFGQLGTGGMTNGWQPTPIGLSDVEALALGDRFSCALTKPHTVLCWGDNPYGQLGNGTTEAKMTPTAVVWP